MIWIDYLIIAIISFSTLVSLTRGLVKEVLSLIIWALAYWMTNDYYEWLAKWFIERGFGSQLVCNGVSIFLLFISILLIGVVITTIMETLVLKTGLTGTDQVLGICFGGLRGICIVAVILLFFNVFTDVNILSDLSKSQLAPRFSGLITLIVNYLKSTSFWLP
ncbi:CvpA family protein [Candidatus Erwinia haradaeae]|uniref:Colicin V production protein n=1 Tax=Candidatus Erwinia haradaeae TaxID=1922217 RepID=A0A451D251_9GAMM|nr:CvpA family protein [Candidatus Erwinia haradaeae]VFP79689.1 Colicin V production protein [Candidatus Erwinia haradaeae]